MKYAVVYKNVYKTKPLKIYAETYSIHITDQIDINHMVPTILN